MWKILGIEETKDKNIIKDAYRTRLVSCNPEDDPEGFMRLRKAYEDALKYSESEEVAEENDENPLLNKLKDIYSDFSKRIDTSVWQELFLSDEFVSLDTSEESLDVMLRFFLDNFHLPQNVWKLIVDNFDFVQRKKELEEKYPGDFVDYIFSNAKYEDLVDYSLFEGESKDIDEFLDLYYSFDAAMRKREIAEEEKYLELMEQSDAYHPYIVICKIKLAIHKLNFTEENADEVVADNKDMLLLLQDEAVNACAAIPEDINMLNICGDIAMIRKDYDKAKEYYDKSLLLAPDNYLVKGKQAELLFVTGEYVKSRDQYIELLKINHYDNHVRAGMIRANMGIIEELSKKIENNPDDNDSRMEISWSYYQSYKFSEAIEMLNQFYPTEEKKCEYYNVMGRSFLCLEKYKEALFCFEKWKQKILEIPEDDNSEDSIKKKKRFEYVNFLIGDCYLKLGEYEEAREYISVALNKEHEEIMLSFEAMCELEYKLANYEDCIKACDNLLEREDRNYIANIMKAKCFYYLGRHNESMNCCERAIGIYPYVAEPYVYMIKTFLKFDQLENAEAIIERFARLGVESDYIDYYKAEILERQDKSADSSVMLQKIIRRNEAGNNSDMENFADVYILEADNQQALSQFNNALDCCDKAISLDNNNRVAHGKKGVLLRIVGKFKDALAELDIQLKLNPHPYFYVNRGLVYKAMRNYSSAIVDFEEAIKYEPDNAFCYMKIGEIYETKNQFDKSLYNYNKALENIETNPKNKPTLYLSLARVKQCIGDFQGSLSDYEAYIAEYGIDAYMAYDYAELLYRMNDFEKCVNVLRDCVNNEEYDEYVERLISRLCYKYGIEGYIDRAYECYAIGVSKNTKNPDIHGCMGDVFMYAGMYEKAREMYLKAVEVDKANERYYYIDVICAMMKKASLMRPKIKPYLQNAHRFLGPDSLPDEYIDMAKLHCALKDYKEAIRLIDVALKQRRCHRCTFGKCHEAYYEKGKIYEEMKAYELALSCYKKALEIYGHNALYEECIKRIEGK